jgi:hypothetical protein
MLDLTTNGFLAELEARRSSDRTQGHEGLRMRDVFALAREFTDLPVGEIEALLAHPSHEVRVGAVSRRPTEPRVMSAMNGACH